MQFTQPGFSNYGQPFVYNTPFQFNGYPEVVGEGNVTSVVSPDGSMQLLFLPTTQWWKPYPCNINAGNVNNTNWNPTGAWFIRSVFSPIQPMTCQPQPYQAPSEIAFHRTRSSQCCVNQPSYIPPFELKFHNDICTSTSDIHYFYPNLRSCDWFPKTKGSTSIQVDVPMATNQPPCEVLCNCAPMDEAKNTVKNICSCRKTSDTSISDMSCETDKPEIDCHYHKNKLKKSRKSKKNKSMKRTNTVLCECKEQGTTDKCVTTFADQASGCPAEKGCETQTHPGNGRETQTAADAGGKGHETQTVCGNSHDTQTACASIPVPQVSTRNSQKDIKPEIWTPKTPESRKAMKIKSSGNFGGVCETGCGSGSCSCHSDTD